MLLKEKFDSKKNKKECLLKKEKVKDDQGWTLFSDFYEITHIIIQESLVTIHKRDHKEMVCTILLLFKIWNSTMCF